MKLIVDGDILLFRSCAAVEKEVTFDGRFYHLFTDFEDARGVLEEMVHEFEERDYIDEVIFAFSDRANWRRNIFKDYKANRKGMRKPLAYRELGQYAEQHWESMKLKGLEADDIMGIYANRDDYAIWSLDKDLKQCPGHHLVDDEIVWIGPDEGDRFHLYQTLVGDVTDNYAGCPGVGDKTANEFLDNPYVYRKTTRVLKSGKNAGQGQIRWEKEPTASDNMWAGVVSHFEKAGLTEHDALTQARVARILRDGEYDFEKERVRLWQPQ